MAYQQSDPSAGDSDAQQTAIALRSHEKVLELRFKGRFSQADLAAVKAIRGRRYDGERRLWLLPHTPAVLAALRLSFRFELSAAAPIEEVRPPTASLPVQSSPVPSEPYDAAAIRILDEMRRTIARPRMPLLSSSTWR